MDDPRSHPGAGGGAHLLGSGAGLLGLATGFTTTQHPLVAAAAGLAGYVGAHLLADPSRARPRAGGATGPGAPAAGPGAPGPEAGEVLAAAQRAAAALRRAAPPADVARAAQHVLDAAAEVLARWDQLERRPPDAAAVRAVVAEHLPRAVAAHRAAARDGDGDAARAAALARLAELRAALERVRERLPRPTAQDPR
ncbi:hypothetical protein [Kineococcus sp. SYSU DK005]|uniref:hypothetical protein n=1 Tax=Kineococcus sp. SYSU DK005 TaxID=3383126 RepID=UPI003D7CFC36